MQKEDVYQTSSFQKQSYRYNIAKFLGLKTPDAFLWLFTQQSELVFIKEITCNIKDDFSEKERKRLKCALKRYLPISTNCSYYTSLLEKDSKSTKEYAEKKLEREAKKHSELIFDLIKLSCYLINKTDLRNTQIPPEQILNAKDNKMPFRPREEYTEAGY